MLLILLIEKISVISKELIELIEIFLRIAVTILWSVSHEEKSSIKVRYYVGG